MSVLVRRLTRPRPLEGEDLAAGLDLIVGGIFTLGLFATQVALYYYRSVWHWKAPDLGCVLLGVGVLAATGIVVQRWGWDQGRIRWREGIVVPILSSVVVLLLVVSRALS
jgi:hypothetical protein